jgi:hypothetical protein
MRYKRILYVGMVMLLFSCQEEIDINLNAADSRIVIEAELTDTPPPYIVRVSHTIAFDKPNNFVAITDAIVILSDDAGNSETLTQDSAGFYIVKTIQATPEHTYNISVQIEDKTYTSQCFMRQSVEIDSLFIRTYSYGAINVRVIETRFTDKANERSFYRLKCFVNNELWQSSIYSDRDVDGKQISASFFSDNPYDDKYQLNTGDTIRIELYAITEEIFNYFRSLRNTSAASPSNPTSNITDALGYFNVCSVKKKEIVVE